MLGGITVFTLLKRIITTNIEWYYIFLIAMCLNDVRMGHGKLRKATKKKKVQAVADRLLSRERSESRMYICVLVLCFGMTLQAVHTS
jgi:hypothetical protein